MKILGFNFLDKSHGRTRLIKKNVFYSFLFKGGSVLITLLLVPLTIKYIHPTEYGVWLTISSVVTWINIFDIGIGNGLKNEIAFSLALKDDSNVRTYVSTTYVVLSLIAILLFLLFFFISSLFDWNQILNVPDNSSFDIRIALLIVLGLFCIQFVAQLINSILSATQQVFKSSLILFSGQALALIAMQSLVWWVPENFILSIIALAGSPVFILILASLFLYRKVLRQFAPSFHKVDFKYVHKLLNIGASFFLIQIGALVLFQTDNIIITSLMGPEAVTTFNIPYKLFSAIPMVLSIVITPYWSAFTEAYAVKDFAWIKDSIKKLRIIWALLSLAAVLVFLVSEYLYQLWIQDTVTVPWTLSLSVMLYIIVFMWQTIHVYFLNGVGIIRLQLILVTASAIINVPLAIYLGERLGLAGVITANTIVFLIMGIIFSYQYKKIVSQVASKVWLK
ncbi:MAG: oligosaccharide flippase family protein [Chryseolinea sp.]